MTPNLCLEIEILLRARQGERKIWREVAFERKDRVAEYRLQGHEASEKKEEFKEQLKATQTGEASDKASSKDKLEI